MAKYSTECKLKVVQEYLAGRGSYETLSKLYHVSRKSIEEWVKVYQAFDDDGLRRSRAQQTYTFEFKETLKISFVARLSSEILQ